MKLNSLLKCAYNHKNAIIYFVNIHFLNKMLHSASKSAARRRPYNGGKFIAAPHFPAAGRFLW